MSQIKAQMVGRKGAVRVRGKLWTDSVGETSFNWNGPYSGCRQTAAYDFARCLKTGVPRHPSISPRGRILDRVRFSENGEPTCTGASIDMSIIHYHKKASVKNYYSKEYIEYHYRKCIKLEHLLKDPGTKDVLWIIMTAFSHLFHGSGFTPAKGFITINGINSNEVKILVKTTNAWLASRATIHCGMGVLRDALDFASYYTAQDLFPNQDLDKIRKTLADGGTTQIKKVISQLLDSLQKFRAQQHSNSPLGRITLFRFMLKEWKGPRVFMYWPKARNTSRATHNFDHGRPSGLYTSRKKDDILPGWLCGQVMSIGWWESGNFNTLNPYYYRKSGQ